VRTSAGKHIRTLNPIESTFTTVRHRTGKTKGCLSRKTGLAPLGDARVTCQAMHGVQADDLSPEEMAQVRWAHRMPEIIQKIAFKDGIKQRQNAA